MESVRQVSFATLDGLVGNGAKKSPADGPLLIITMVRLVIFDTKSFYPVF